ncbi:MAG: hypothetical protein C5S46_07120 [Candidatus Methanomarinus sp.]|uniref:Uncharacterized protein n=1 Tax=Candidatus Methanomarinus sp. TaxID=3386244 RepID=A0AC61S8Y9_9EURY|nr:MAG: hypothetical protein C5S46_07120 [ANME-2 cluster archaeon]
MCYQAYKRQDTANGILGVGSQPIVPTKQGNACGGKGLTVEPLGQGHIHRTQMRVKDGNKTVPITYPPKKKRGWGGSSEEPDEGNLHVRFCEL